MKTINNTLEKVSVLKQANLSYVIVFVFLNLSVVNAQDQPRAPYRFGAGVGAHISGNAHGSIYDIYGSLYNGKNLISFGTCFQNNSNAVSGVRLSYSYMLTGEDDLSKNNIKNFVEDRLQLYVFSYCQYLHNARLSSGVVKQEQLSNIGVEHQLDYNSIKLSTIDLGAGFGLNLKLTKKLVWGNYVGISTMYHTNYTSGLCSDKIAPVLIIGTTFGFNFL